jgi:hypothetical protein
LAQGWFEYLNVLAPTEPLEDFVFLAHLQGDEQSRGIFFFGYGVIVA